ncbi:MOSC N-terminal beta barrel domain-containing protein [Castellaniella caeni]|uniref:MOSC N-terminal beta barrel domain-containing protein n=1 Tax=Castellaniella caeni TaxID=266123 RepID=UPI000A00B46B|nr:MOSC N-terminal beta barrel domain-containing protein [Castellaniella caeni]
MSSSAVQPVPVQSESGAQPAGAQSAPAVRPIAGAAALAQAGAAAPACDHRWLVVDAQGRWLTAQQAAGLGALDLSLRFGYLVIRAPGMLRLDIPLDVIEDDDSVERVAHVGTQAVRVVDEGDLAAAWFAQWLGLPCRLMKVHPDAPTVAWPS